MPEYLHEVKKEMSREKTVLANYLSSQVQQNCGSASEEVSEEERRKLINALKAKWGTVNAEYQKGAHLSNLDTVGKVRRKEQLEKSLNEIEKEIALLEKANKIIVT